MPALRPLALALRPALTPSLTPRRNPPLALALSLALALTPAVAAARGLSPDDAAAQRERLEAQLTGTALTDIDKLEDWANETGDPELFLAAAGLARDEAASRRDTELAARAEALAWIARDIGAHLGDARNFESTDWRPVSQERGRAIAAEASAVASQARALIDEILAERAAAEAEAERARLAALAENDKKRELKPGTGLIAGGSAALVIGVGGLGMFAAGLAMGASNQRQAEALILPAELPRLDELDRKGATANTIAIAGGVLGGVGIAVGAALIAVGVKKRKASGAGPDERASVHVGGWFGGHGAGLNLRGSF